MSYCRWSSDDFACDLYCYESAEGWVTHVAGNRHVGKCPHFDWRATPEDWAVQIEAQHRFLEMCERQPIGLAYDGESFLDGTLADFKATLLKLRAAGYRFPDYVLNEVNEEMKEEEQ